MSMPQPAAPAGGPRRAVAMVAVVVVLAVPLAILFAAFWSGKASDHDFNAGKQRGVAYLKPLTELIGTVVTAQSAAVRGQPVDRAAVERAIAAVDEVDGRYGEDLATTERWSQLRETVKSVTALKLAQPTDAFSVYSELMDTAVALARRVGDESNLIIDPKLDAYYVMNAALLRVPDVIVAAGRYADLVYLVVGANQVRQVERIGQLSTARQVVLSSAADLEDGLEKAFDATRSDTLGPELLRPLDNFRTAVDTLAPRNGPLAPASIKPNPAVVAAAAADLESRSITLNRAALGQLDDLIAARTSADTRALLLAAVGLGVAVLVAAGAIWWLARQPRSGGLPPAPRPMTGARHGGRDPASLDARELVASNGMTVAQRRGGARAAR
jgi:hypothetical protein